MSEKKGTTTAAGVASSARITGTNERQPDIPRYRSGGTQNLTNFLDKTKELNGKIFDIIPGQGAKFLATQEEIAEYATRTNPKGHSYLSSTSHLNTISYEYLSEPTGTDFDGNDC